MRPQSSHDQHTIISLLEWRASHDPGRVGYVFVSDGVGEIRLTYGELDRRARSIASLLGRVAAPGDCAILLYPAGLDFLAAFFGCLYAGVVAIPLFPPRPNREDIRLNSIAEDSGAKLALTVRRALPDLSMRGPSWRALKWIATDDANHEPEDRRQELSITADNLAYLQYTSGSTSNPKGVMVSHANLVYNCGLMQENWDLSADTLAVTWLPHFHDMGLIEGLLNPLYAGFPVVFMPPARFVARPILWLQLITRYRATHSGAPNFAYDLCGKRVSDEQLSGLDLSSWKVAYSGAEPVRSETMDRFAERFAACGFQHQAFSPCYGLAEATLMVSGSTKAEPPIVMEVDAAHLERSRIAVPAGGAKSRRLASSGYGRRKTRILIVDPETKRACPEGTVGEIWVAGPTLAQGYWKQPEESAATFNAFVSDTGDGPCLRTGDLGFLAGRELFVTGRSKDLIIVRGANFYPQDIEAVAERAHPALRLGGGVAFSVENDNMECIVVGHELDRTYRNVKPGELERIAAAIRRAVSEEFDIEVHAVQLLKIGSVYKTSSGKIQRQACRADFLEGRSETLFESRLPARESAEKVEELVREELLALSPGERRFVLEERMRKHVALVLQMPWRQIDPSEPLGSYGLESLKGYQLIAQLEDSLGVTIPATTIYNYPSLDGLSRYIAGMLEIDVEIPRNSSVGAPVAPVRAFDDERAAEILRAVANISVSELEQIIADKRRRDAEQTARGNEP